MNIQDGSVAIGIDVPDGDGDVLRRSSIEPGLCGCCCYLCWAASAFAALVVVQAQAPCEGHAPSVVVLAQTIAFVHEQA